MQIRLCVQLCHRRSPESERRVNILQVARLTFYVLRVCLGRATCILLSEASCLPDASKKGHGGGGLRTVPGVIALSGVTDTHRADTRSAGSGRKRGVGAG